MSSVFARACVPARVGPSRVSERVSERVSARRSSVRSPCDLRSSRRAVVGRATSGDGEDGSSPRERSAAASSLDALDKLFSSMDEAESSSSGPARADDPFASIDDDHEGASTRRTSSSSASSSSSSFEGSRRAREGRTELDDFFDVGMRFEGGKTLLKALTGGSALGTDLGALRVGQLAVVSIDKPSLALWESQAYEVRRAYYQRRGDELGSDRSDVRALGDAPPARASDAADDEWVLMVELFSPEYHATPVRVRPEEVGLKTVGAEIGDALKIAVPVAFFWASVSAAFIITSSRG